MPSFISSRFPSIGRESLAVILPLARSKNGGSFLMRASGGVFSQDGMFVPLAMPARPDLKYFDASPVDLSKTDIKTAMPAAIYGGVVFDHYGHFLLQSMSRLWILSQNVLRDSPIIFHASSDIGLRDYQREIFRRLGILDRVLVCSTPLAVEHLIIPEPALVYNQRAQKIFLEPFETIARLSPRKSSSDRLYISRTHLETSLSVPENELEDVFRVNGYRIIYPEELPIEEQIKIFRGGRRFAGVTGSSMHNLLFAEPSTIATYINRFSYVRPTYRMIDELKNIEAHYIAGCDTTIQPAATESPDPVRLNMDAIVKGLQDCGAITKTQISYNNSAAFYDNLYIAAAYLRRAQKLGWSGKHKEAMDECDTGLARVKNDPKLLLEKARNIKYLGDPKAAFSICMELLRRHPLDENILRTTAEWGRGLIEKAQHDDLIQRLSVIHPKSDYSTLLVARWHFDSGRLDTCLNELHSLKKMDDRAYTIQIRCLIGLSRLEEALEKINEARRNLKDIDISILRLAVTVCEKLEDIDSAYIYAKSCLKEDPDNPEMVQHVKRFMEQLAAPHTDDMRVTTTSNVA